MSTSVALSLLLSLVVGVVLAEKHIKFTHQATTLDPEFRDYLEEDGADYNLHYLTHRKVSEVGLPDRCPKPSHAIIQQREGCSSPPCSSHTNCTNANESCCFNGCVFTCLIESPPPEGFTWDQLSNNPPIFLDKSIEEYEIECSTGRGFTTSSCPDGYACQILELGDPLKAIPNRGVCTSLKDLGPDGLGLYTAESAADWNQLESAIIPESVYLPGGCLLTTEQFNDIEEFIKGRHFTSCTCSAGTVLCAVPQMMKKDH